MMTFFSLISTVFSSIFYGLIITIAVMAILYAVLRSFNEEMVCSIPFLVTGVILAGLLTVQFSLMVGAIQAKHLVTSVEIYLNQLLEDKYGIVDAQDSQKVMDAVTENFPVIGNFIDAADFTGHDISELPEVMHETMSIYLSSYIWHRVWWILCVVVVACIIVVLFENNNTGNHSRTRRRVSVMETPRHRRKY